MNIDNIITEVLNEFQQAPPIQPQGQPQQAQQPRQPGDVQSMNRALQTSSTMQKANQRINTATEFPEAFRVWFQGLGYKPDNPQISIMKVKTAVGDMMTQMGFK
jgi:hypothetical protein